MTTAILWAGALVLLCALVGCATPARPEADPTPTAIAASATTAPVATPVAQGDTPTPAAPTATRQPPSPAEGSSSALPPQLEPTATPTATPATPSPTPTPIPTSAEIAGWLTYENDFLGYRFSYPPEATIRYHGTTEEPPEVINSRSEYLAWLQTVYPNDLCVSVGYKTGFIAVHPRDETLSLQASPCGITGIGDQRLEEWQETVTIDGKSYTANALRLYSRQTDAFESEYYILLDVNDTLRIDFAGDITNATTRGQPELSEQAFEELIETLRLIVESFRFQ